MASRRKATASLLSPSSGRGAAGLRQSQQGKKKKKNSAESHKCAQVQGKSRVCTYSMVVEGWRSLRDKIPEPGELGPNPGPTSSHWVLF